MDTADGARERGVGGDSRRRLSASCGVGGGTLRLGMRRGGARPVRHEPPRGRLPPAGAGTFSLAALACQLLRTAGYTTPSSIRLSFETNLIRPFGIVPTLEHGNNNVLAPFRVKFLHIRSWASLVLGGRPPAGP